MSRAMGSYKQFVRRVAELARRYNLRGATFDTFISDALARATQVASEIESQGLEPSREVVQNILSKQRVPSLSEIAISSQKAEQQFAASSVREERFSRRGWDSFEDIGFDSKYRFVLVVAERAEQLMRGAIAKMSLPKGKPTSVAMEEILRGLVSWGYGPLEQAPNFAPPEAHDTLSEKQTYQLEALPASATHFSSA